MSRQFRKDVEGLRAVAILLVIAFHASVPELGGGFVGVDVFFVISGFLITGIIARELRETGRLDLVHFWARRIRRLLPAATVLTIATSLAALALLSPLRYTSLASDSLASTGYWSNALFSVRATNYFAEAMGTSPFLHMWSLAVEEQFYIGWPLLLLLFARIRLGTVQARLVGGMALVFLFSLLLCVLLTRHGTPWAFFSSPTRAWQFAAGGLLALAGIRLPRGAQSLGAHLGLLLVLASAVGLDGSGHYPGLLALMPTAGTLLIVASGTASASGAAWLLEAPVVRWVGRLSYSWYLWHWPAITIALVLWPDLNLLWRLLVMALTLAVAALSYYGVENRWRFHPRLSKSNKKTYAFGLVLVMVGSLFAGILYWRGRTLESSGSLAPLVAAAADRAVPELKCGMLDAAELRRQCTLNEGQQLVVVLGDSHARQWSPAISSLGEELGFATINSVWGACPSIPVPVLTNQGLPSRSCAKRHREQASLIQELDPALVVISNSARYLDGRIDAPIEESLKLWQEGLQTLGSQLEEMGIPLLVILDTPNGKHSPLDCIARTGTDQNCGFELAELGGVRRAHAAERAALSSLKLGSHFDPLPLLCGVKQCPVRMHGQLVYKDNNHLTASFARSLAPKLRASVEKALRAAPSGSNSK